MKSEFFCVAVEGATTDGRVIEAGWIVEMAANYDPKTYTANVNVEHIRGYSPEAPFNNYGSILALEARTVELNINGKTETKKALFAQVDGNDQLVALSKAGQKRFPSIEVNPNFAGRGQAYCVGLGMTDSPASLGTEMLQFASKAKANPFATRKLDTGNLFSAADSVDAVLIEFKEETPAIDPDSLVERIVAKFSKVLTPKEEPKPEPQQQLTDPNAALVAAFTTGLKELGSELAGAMKTSSDKADARFAKLEGEITALKTDVEATPSRAYTQRPPATGGEGVELADC